MLVENELFVPLVHISIGVLLFLLGYLVKVKQWNWLIAGYNTSSAEEQAKYDTVALCRGVGKLLYSLGSTLFAASLGFFLEASWITSMSWGLFIVGVIVFLVYANTGGRYKK